MIRPRLLAFSRRVRQAALLRGTAWLLVGLLGALLVLCLLDNLVHLPSALRLIALFALAGWAGRAAWTGILVPLRQRVSAEAAARAVEEHDGRRDNLLINACQFEAQELPAGAQAILAPSLAAAERQLSVLPLAGLCRLRALGIALGLILVLGLVWGAYGRAYADHAGNALRRVVLPLADLPPLGEVVLALQPGGSVAIDDGLPLELQVTVRALSQAGERAGAPELRFAEGLAELPAEVDLARSCSEVLPLESLGSQRWRARLPAVRRSGAIRAFCAGSASPLLRLQVRPPPRLTNSVFIATPPAWAGSQEVRLPGPPADAAILPGGSLGIELACEPELESLVLRFAGSSTACRRGEGRWRAAFSVRQAGPYELLREDGRLLARGAVALEADRPPEAALEAGSDNLVALPGSTLDLRLAASDDHGLHSLALVVRDAATGSAWEPRRWELLGPPGPPKEQVRHRLDLDPARFAPGRAYVLETRARDRNPAGQEGVSRPVVLRIKAVGDISAGTAGEAPAVAALKEAIARQREALGQSDNLGAQFAEALAGRRLAGHRDGILRKQGEAQAAGRKAREAYAKAQDLQTARNLEPVVEGEMGLVAGDLARLPTLAADPARACLQSVRDRQDWILQQLIALLGESVANDLKREQAPAEGRDGLPPETTREAVNALSADLDRFLRDQQKLLERSRSLLDQRNLDLGDERDKLLGDLARDQAELSKFLEEKLTDFSKLPPQDFSDGSLLSEFNAVYQEISQADAALYKKQVEIAVPHEQSGLELAEALQHNLEKWLASHPDNKQWKMEEATAPADVPISELPKQLEDIVGDLLDQEEEMAEAVEDFSSAWMDNLDKGAGWEAGDGPISNMSAKGVTGNVLPNQNEVGGRSGEGRSGKSSGQMVEDSAVGKGGRETPTRLSPSPFESGSVKDQSQDPTGGATGGGKLGGADSEGLRGPVPPPLAEQMKRLAGMQAQIRQQTGALAVELRKRNHPSADLESAASAMQALEDAAAAGQGSAIRRRYSEAVDALREGRRQVGASGLGRERLDLERTIDRERTQTSSPRVPVGYEDMAAEYFRRLNQGER